MHILFFFNLIALYGFFIYPFTIIYTYETNEILPFQHDGTCVNVSTGDAAILKQSVKGHGLLLEADFMLIW